MKLQEWMKSNNLKNEGDITQLFQSNLLRREGIYFIYSCIKCDEIVLNPMIGCPICNKKEV